MEDNKGKYVHDDVVHNLVSPRIIVPFIMQLLSPSSVVDVGCGTGTFLKVFKDCGVSKVLGIDGSWVKPDQLHINENEFIEADLEKPVRLEEKFDLVLCLEVAEHLSPNSADIIVESLVSLGKVIVFSAAITLQGGQNHINEQPISYWQAIFNKHDYHFYDVFRKEFWNNKQVDWWYKQNMFLVMHKSAIAAPSFEDKKVDDEVLLQIHPDLLALHIIQKKNALEKVEFYKNRVSRIKAGDEVWKLYRSIIIKKIKKSLYLREN